ncbi:GTP pyrophosphokinase [Rathayibacter tritici]|uniref:RelA/SpoT domain-containing protein n=1 Tax=Rathayibacter tritici TaxID=33888 RepID=A0A160KT28_9MICO|nr:RelA/SpoT domain-containing protein [Rathayibacter tritici]AND16932.1 hypothetical protein A6122_1803 [Rathayibacter tritici]PPI43507.1 hypothetical protein C5D18_08790 [Rathayibacter tritici]
MSSIDSVDFTNWDWLPRAAEEVEGYVQRLLAESSIQPHAVSARAKSIASFQRKQRAKKYADPMGEITDIVAIRIITYSNTDRDRVGELIRSRFAVLPGEDRNPGEEKPKRLRGYDCLHIVVSGEVHGHDSDWVVSGGELERYFTTFGGLEIQIRTVAGHAWAEFEHARRYKGAQYEAVGEQDRVTIDQLFGAASDARRALDETFVAIDRILARPSFDEESRRDQVRVERETGPGDATASTPLDVRALCEFLESRFPDDTDGSEKGIEFGIELARCCGIDTVDQLESALEDVDSEQVRALMESGGPVTRVRRLDDELLARFGQDYIEKTTNTGTARHRGRQLEWRYDRLRGKTRYRSYLLLSRSARTEFDAGPYTAIGALREVARIIASKCGREAVALPGVVSLEPDLPPRTRAKRVSVDDDSDVWVISNLGREAVEGVMADLLSRVCPFDLRVVRGDVVVADGRSDRPERAADDTERDLRR